jgi:hypothetical protein
MLGISVAAEQLLVFENGLWLKLAVYDVLWSAR